MGESGVVDRPAGVAAGLGHDRERVGVLAGDLDDGCGEPIFWPGRRAEWESQFMVGTVLWVKRASLSRQGGLLDHDQNGNSTDGAAGGSCTERVGAEEPLEQQHRLGEIQRVEAEVGGKERGGRRKLGAENLV